MKEATSYLFHIFLSIFFFPFYLKNTNKGKGLDSRPNLSQNPAKWKGEWIQWIVKKGSFGIWKAEAFENDFKKTKIMSQIWMKLKKQRAGREAAPVLLVYIEIETTFEIPFT